MIIIIIVVVINCTPSSPGLLQTRQRVCAHRGLYNIRSGYCNNVHKYIIMYAAVEAVSVLPIYYYYLAVVVLLLHDTSNYKTTTRCR
jgi:hypothetical protein